MSKLARTLKVDITVSPAIPPQSTELFKLAYMLQAAGRVDTSPTPSARSAYLA